jgi:hypothetical protein
MIGSFSGEGGSRIYEIFAGVWADQSVARQASGAPRNAKGALTGFARMDGYLRLSGCGFWLVEEGSSGAHR